MAADTHDLEIARYVVRNAPVLFLILDPDGAIRHVNRFAAGILGEHVIGKAFHDVIIDSRNRFQLGRAATCPDTVHLLNVETRTGAAQTYHFHFYASNGDVLAFGHLDVDEIESLSNELVAANQELNNLTRQLNARNRELKRANAKITEMTRTDPLTQLANRRYFDERILEMVSLANRKSQPLSLIMTDIDRFKSVNDNYGHDAGDRVLQGYAGLMKNITRAEDLVARFGGEEFIVLLPLTTIRQAHALAERIRTALSGCDLLGNGRLVTASFGVCQFVAGERIETFIKRADTALYQAKASGRNRTGLADSGTSTEMD